MSRLLRVGAIVSVCLVLRCFASSAEPIFDLVTMIPPGAAFVAGMESTHHNEVRPSLFLPLPRTSLRDFDYFNSLCGADPGKSVGQVIFVDSDLNGSRYGHTLIAKGHFNSQILYKSPLSWGATRASYGGLTVIRLQRMAQEHSGFHETILLEVIESRFLLLGTQEYVQEEIDRYLAAAAPESVFAEQIDAARRSDVWWILLKPSDTSVVKRSLMSLDPDLAEVVMQPNVSVRMRYGRKAVFEYQVLSSPGSESASMWESIPQMARPNS